MLWFPCRCSGEYPLCVCNRACNSFLFCVGNMRDKSSSVGGKLVRQLAVTQRDVLGELPLLETRSNEAKLHAESRIFSSMVKRFHTFVYT